MFFNTKTLIKNRLLGYSVQRKYLKTNNLITCLFITFISIIILQFYASNSWGYQKKHDEIKFSLDSKGMTIEEICEEIYKLTRYKILINGPTPQKKIMVKFQNNSLSEVIATLINRADVTNYTIIRDDVNRTIRVNIYDSGGALARTPEKGRMDAKDITANEVEPGFSYNDMENATIKYNKQKQDLRLTDEVEPGFTYQDMENVIKKYREQKQAMVSTDEVEPGFTYKAMEYEIKKYHERTKLIKKHKQKE